jgi:hypothetical protein
MVGGMVRQSNASYPMGAKLSKMTSCHIAKTATRHGCDFSEVSSGVNQWRATRDTSTSHAEVSAINTMRPRGRGKLRSIVLFVIRVNVGGTLGESHPCCECMKYIRYTVRRRGYIITNVYYSTRGGLIKNMRVSQMTHIHIPRWMRTSKENTDNNTLKSKRHKCRRGSICRLKH